MGENIEIRNLNVRFSTNGKTIQALRDVNLIFREKKITALIGESGSGKSVLGMSILKLLPATAEVEGSCFYRNRNLYELSEKEICKIRCREISLIPQNPLMSLNPVLKIGRQLAEPLWTHLKVPRKDAWKAAEENLEKFSFRNPKVVMNQYSFQMSGGMNQRIVSCMGLECGSSWVIADEPTKGLDSILRRQVYEVLCQARSNGSSSMILITHDLQLARKLCDYMAVLYQGHLVEQGTVQAVMEHPCHPYTRGLLNAMPARGMHSIPLAVKGQKREDSGCPFYSRCQEASLRCRKADIMECAVSPDQSVRCMNYA